MFLFVGRYRLGKTDGNLYSNIKRIKFSRSDKIVNTRSLKLLYCHLWIMENVFWNLILIYALINLIKIENTIRILTPLKLNKYIY